MKYKRDKLMIWLMVVAAILILLTSILKVDGGQATTYREITVKQGDTLWQYWNEYGSGRYDKWVHETMQLNGMETVNLQVGETIKVWEVVE